MYVLYALVIEHFCIAFYYFILMFLLLDLQLKRNIIIFTINTAMECPTCFVYVWLCCIWNRRTQCVTELIMVCYVTFGQFFFRNLTSTTYCNTNSKEAFQWTVNIICHEQWYAITSKVAAAVWIECPEWKPKIVNDGIHESLCNGFGFGFGLHIRINFPCTYYYDLLIVRYQSVIFTSYSCTLCYLRSPA